MPVKSKFDRHHGAANGNLDHDSHHDVKHKRLHGHHSDHKVGNRKLKRPDSRLQQRGEWDKPDVNRVMKAKIEQARQLEDGANSHQIVYHLAKRTHFTADQVKALMNIYKRLISLGKMDRLRFREILYSMFNITDDIILDRTFGAFDGDNQGSVSEVEWIIGMSCFLRGTLEEQIAYCYEVYDINGDRSIGREEVQAMLRNCINPLPGDGTYGIDPEEVGDASRDVADLAIQKLDVDRNGIISFGDFYDACSRDPNLLESLGPCLPSVKQLKQFLILFADDYTVFTTNYSHPHDLGWDRERNKYARRESINQTLKQFDRSVTGVPLLTFRDRKKAMENAIKNRKRTLPLDPRIIKANPQGNRNRKSL